MLDGQAPLNGKAILVTGSSSGIGLATARAAHEAGALVVLHGLAGAELEAAAAGLGAPAVAADLADPEAVERLAREAVGVHGRLDGLVNNAGIFPRTTLEAADAGAFDRIMAVNARAPMLLSRAVALAWRAEGRAGSIVNVGSVNAHAGQPDLLVYSMSKGALATMTRNMADALAPDGIRVNQVNPGWVLTETELRTQAQAGRPEGWQASLPGLFVPRGRLLAPGEVARHILFWLSELSAPVTGSVVDVEQVPFLGRNTMSRMVP